MRVVQRWLPEPFIFAIILTFVAAILAMPICHQTPIEVVEHWGGGVWNLLAFAMQMALVLVCGSALAAAPIIKRGISSLASLPKNPAGAIALVTGISAIACWLNWGFGLIVGVIFAKEIARKMSGVDYRLLIASAYSGFVVWHAGLSEEQLREAAKLAVCKINIDSDIRLAMTGNIRKYFAEHPDHFDPRQYLKPARQAVKDMVAHKIVNVLGSDGKA